MKERTKGVSLQAHRTTIKSEAAWPKVAREGGPGGPLLEILEN